MMPLNTREKLADAGTQRNKLGQDWKNQQQPYADRNKTKTSIDKTSITGTFKKKL